MSDVRVNPIDGAELVWIPSGEFLRGSNDAHGNEKPQRQIYLDEYWIYKHPVTFAQYAAYCALVGTPFPEKPRWGWNSDHPVINVTWHDASAYSAWANAFLPTEAEWEKAARGTGGREYPWGNQWTPKCCRNSVDGSVEGTVSVATHPAGKTPFGAHDMSGNVWEWCADWFSESYYRSSPDRNPSGPDTRERRVVRGGSWYDDTPGNFRCSCRGGFHPGLRYGNLGFRCVIRPTVREATP